MFMRITCPAQRSFREEMNVRSMSVTPRAVHRRYKYSVVLES
jgi:hypothetical protein